MKRTATLIFAVAAAIAAGTAQSAVRLNVPGEDAGPPFYSQIQRTQGPERYFIPRTSEWAAIPWNREPVCVPPDFDLLNLNDFTPAFPGGPPRPFLCPLVVEGFVIFEDGPPPLDLAPILSQLRAAPEVPIWFVATSELEAAAADGDLTLLELLAMPSLTVGLADFYKETVQPGIERPQGPGNGKIEINASGELEGGGRFRMHVREQGEDGTSLTRHVRIELEFD